VHIQHFQVLFQAVLVKINPGAKTGIVDQNSDIVPSYNHFQQPLHVLFFRQLGFDRFSPDPVFPG